MHPAPRARRAGLSSISVISGVNTQTDTCPLSLAEGVVDCNPAAHDLEWSPGYLRSILRPGTRMADILHLPSVSVDRAVRDGSCFPASCFRQNAAASGPCHRQRTAPINWDAPNVASRLGLRRGFGIFSPPAPRGFFVGPGHHLRRRGSITIDGRHQCRPSSFQDAPGRAQGIRSRFTTNPRKLRPTSFTDFG
jgi:hypothetical protein